MNKIISLLALVIIAFGCSSHRKRSQPSESIAVRWELITNFTDKPNVFEAKFELINNSDL